MNRSEHKCPKCGQWIGITPTTPQTFKCSWCGELLQIRGDALVKLSHVQQMVNHGKEFKHK